MEFLRKVNCMSPRVELVPVYSFIKFLLINSCKLISITTPEELSIFKGSEGSICLSLIGSRTIFESNFSPGSLKASTPSSIPLFFSRGGVYPVGD